MEEESLRFWIIPIVCLAVFGVIFVFAMNHQVNVVMPNAALEHEEIRLMSCAEFTAGQTQSNYWTSENRMLAETRAEDCSEAAAAKKKVEKEKLDKLLADPNSYESLSRELKQLEKDYSSYKELYDFHAAESAILKQNVTNFENRLIEVKSQLARDHGISD